MKKINNTSSHLSDYELVQAAQAGDTAAVAALYDRYFAALYRFCYWQTNRSEDAEDLTQDVLVAMVKGIKQFSFQSSFRNWLYAIAKRVIAAWLKQKYRLPQVEYAEFLQEIGDDDSWLADDNQVKKHAYVEKLLATLAIRDQNVMKLRYLRGFTQAEIAKQLHISVTNVKVICHRCVRKLAQVVAKDTEQIDKSGYACNLALTI